MDGGDKVPTFKKATIHEIFRLVWASDRLSSLASASEPPPKINDAALHLSAEYLRLFTVELFHRANQAAESEPQPPDTASSSQDYEIRGLIEVRHLQKVAPGVLLDF
ncbi:hypothetical protein O181_040574 [Austropuccinia psidii MF-1]|uniref:Uncharacterized protein n=1 Tax=Austropuccinia psidii MF-1 TaxID=1389203 RepID=A0A9Q3HFN3_9BASI|nr:hypothetical protein [Austropuccinia psidii MF-1]